MELYHDRLRAFRQAKIGQAVCLKRATHEAGSRHLAVDVQHVNQGQVQRLATRQERTGQTMEKDTLGHATNGDKKRDTEKKETQEDYI